MPRSSRNWEEKYFSMSTRSYPTLTIIRRGRSWVDKYVSRIYQTIRICYDEGIQTTDRKTTCSNQRTKQQPKINQGTANNKKGRTKKGRRKESNNYYAGCRCSL